MIAFSSWLCNQAFLLSNPVSSKTQTPSSVHIFFFFCPTDRPTITRDGAIGNKTFYWDGLNHLAGTASKVQSNLASIKYVNPALMKTIRKCNFYWTRLTWSPLFLDFLKVLYFFPGWLCYFKGRETSRPRNFVLLGRCATSCTVKTYERSTCSKSTLFLTLAITCSEMYLWYNA